MELRKEYADIVERVRADCGVEQSDIWTLELIGRIALACQALADRPMKELTDAEIKKLFLAEYGLGCNITQRDVRIGRAAIAAHIAKQREPEVVKVEVRLYRTNSGQPNCVSQVDASLDANFPFGNPTYKWIGEAFEITPEVV